MNNKILGIFADRIPVTVIHSPAAAICGIFMHHMNNLYFPYVLPIALFYNSYNNLLDSMLKLFHKYQNE